MQLRLWLFAFVVVVVVVGVSAKCLKMASFAGINRTIAEVLISNLLFTTQWISCLQSLWGTCEWETKELYAPQSYSFSVILMPEVR